MANEPIKEVVVNGETYPLEANPITLETEVAEIKEEIGDIKEELTADDDLKFQFAKSGSKYGYRDTNGNFVPFKTAHTGTYTATQRSASLDMGEDHEYRYVNTNSVPNTNSETYYASTNGTKDMGITNKYRYVSINVSARLVGAYDVETSIDISAYGATSVNQFLCVNDTGDVQGNHDNDDMYQIGEFQPASLSLNGNTLSLTPSRLRVYTTDSWGSAKYLRTVIYFIG